MTGSAQTSPVRRKKDAGTETAACAPVRFAADQHPVRATVALLPLLLDDESSLFSWCTRLLANETAGQGARLRVRSRLTLCHWSGDVDAVAGVVGELVDNAVRHGRPFPDGYVMLRVALTAETNELIIEVDDALPAFPGFEEMSADREFREPRPVLWWVHHYGGLSWYMRMDADGEPAGKTVRAILPTAREVGA
ncbi:ATP-binding protein [Streptomyces sp. NPDC101151]|uniref:ATP-binding protein n=1 Tax=Streptomyces sp. NPDC101151 TaxID=3366115 RepID=UPI0038191A4F